MPPFPLIKTLERQSRRFNRIQGRFEDKVERIKSVAGNLYCKCGDRESTPMSNLQLIASLPSMGKRKRRSEGKI